MFLLGTSSAEFQAGIGVIESQHICTLNTQDKFRALPAS